MHRFNFLLVVLIITGATASVVEKETQQITDETGHVLTLNITHRESEEDIDVHNENGNHIMTIDMMEKEGYQIDKPANESVCLLSKMEEVETVEKDSDSTDKEIEINSLCYDRVLCTQSNVSQEIQEHCSGRDMYVLVPRTCSGEEANTLEPETEDGGIVKRGLGRWSCRWKYYYTLRYCKVRYCCWWCRRSCYKYTLCWVKVIYFKCGYNYYG
ncbi:uncharacterized protein LOC132739901 isoform X2 [Ruditapes philippinarum]|uniref:uncharacterized protein LOC132739901 isoform X2 n=1 Tax=Ruditapes philippinarum TaxID=129788 RepID=UPI00295B88D0|nr:uncharacterized protein LOC132739901 isoform X2 [Ruditapes philippinarum]